MSALRRSSSSGGGSSLGCGCLFIVVAVVGIACFLAIGMSVDFPGADALRSAAREGGEIFREARESLPEESAVPPPAASPAQTPVPNTVFRPVSTSRPTPPQPATATPPPDPHLYNLQLYMMELINEERALAGVPPVTLGDSPVAQLHAEISLEECFSGHWGVDGLKPYMRYSLAGGYQANGENASGSSYCITASDRFPDLGSMRDEIREMMDGWMSSPGHRRNILDRWYRKVNIGLAWDEFNAVGYQHFEADFVRYSQVPRIESGTLTLTGRTINGVRFPDRDALDLQIYFDPPPHPLTRGQLSRTFCYDTGLHVASIRYPLSGRTYWNEHGFEKTYSPCLDPYYLPQDAPAPRSHEEAREYWEMAYEASQNRTEWSLTIPLITASEWTARDTTFSVTADIGPLLDHHGPGVYTVLIWSEMAGEDVPVSQYSIFHRIEPPDTYNPGS